MCLPWVKGELFQEIRFGLKSSFFGMFYMSALFQYFFVNSKDLRILVQFRKPEI